MVREVCKSILAEYANEVVACPTTTHEWQQIFETFRVNDDEDLEYRFPSKGAATLSLKSE